MIKITKLRKDNEICGFLLQGHAGYSIPGRDIVCAAISAITINTINSIDQLTSVRPDVIEADACTIYAAENHKDESVRTLLMSAKIGYKSIAEEYPEYVELA